MKNPANDGAWSLFDLRYSLTPITIAWIQYSSGGQSVAWRSLYLFGFRIARWRADA